MRTFVSCGFSTDGTLISASAVPQCGVGVGGEVKMYKHLGIMFDDKLFWTSQVDEVVHNVNTRLYCLRKLR